MSEVLENVCTNFDDYVQATYKSNGQPLIFRIMTRQGTMNPLMSQVDITQDADLNKSLKYYVRKLLKSLMNFLIIFVLTINFILINSARR